MKIKVGVVGASGYAGGEAVRLLYFHPNIELNYISSRKYVGKYFHTIYPNFRKVLNIKFEDFSLETIKERCDVVFLAVPHGVSQEFVPSLLEEDIKVIDLSADFRIKDKEVYYKYYKTEHQCPQLLKEAVYGLPELHKNEIEKANLVAVAGCHASSAIYGLYPLIKNDLIIRDKIIIDSKTGSSGSGASVNDSSHHPIRSNSIRPYKIKGHRHTAEIEQELSSLPGFRGTRDKLVKVGFSAHAVNLVRGIFSTIHTFYKNEAQISDRQIFKIYRNEYNNKPFLRLINQNVGLFRLPDPKIIFGTNYCDIGFRLDKHMGRIVIVSTLDNLIKGTAGNAVQCFNIMFRFSELLGLDFVGYFPC